jgi:cytidylate kinase
MENKIVVAIDGYSSCGKSTIAKALAQYAGYTYVDTGAMYRAVALYVIRHGINTMFEELQDATKSQIVAMLKNVKVGFVYTNEGQHVTLNDDDVEGCIRTLEVGNMASQISTIKEVRSFLVTQQQAMGNAKGVVMDGRDIGTVVFPNAELKLFLTASPEVRARRRYLELQAKGENPVWDDVVADVNDRDYRDTHRTESPLTQAEDAVVVDNSEMTPDEQMQHIIALFKERCATT